MDQELKDPSIKEEMESFNKGRVFGLLFEKPISLAILEANNPYSKGTRQYENFMNGYYESFK